MPLNFLRSNLERGMDFMRDLVIQELQNQGHVATGRIIDTMQIVITRTPNGFKGQLFIQDYALILDSGVRAERVPYSRGSGAGKSRYISALEEWIDTVKPGLSPKERLSFAFAIAQTAKREGHPTRGSFAFSTNGRRREWARYALTNNLGQFQDLLNLGQFVAASFDNLANELRNIVVG